MTSLFSQYLNRELFRAYLLMMAVLVSLFSVFALINELGDVGDGNYTIMDAVLVVALTVPSLIIDLAPFSVMLGALYGLAVFARHQELVAIRAAGLSPLFIALCSLISTVLFIVLLVGFEIIARPLNQNAVMYRSSETSPDGQLLSRSGFWFSRRDRFANVSSLGDDDQPRGISAFEFDGHRLRRYLFADSAETIDADSWKLHGVTENRLAAQGALEIKVEDQMSWSPLWSYQKQIYELPVTSLELVELYEEASEKGSSMSKLRAVEFWKRVLLPVTCIAFALFAAPFALARATRGTLGVRLALGVFAMLALFLIQQIGINVALLAGVSPLIAVALPSLLILVAAVVTLIRLR